MRVYESMIRSSVAPAGETKRAGADYSPSDLRMQAWFLRASRAAAALVTLLGVVVLAGWAMNVTILKQLSTSWASMKANTALSFGLLGGACWFAPEGANAKLRRWLASAVIAIATATAYEYVFSVDWGIDQLLFRDAGGGALPGRMAPVTALNFFLLGLAALAVDSRQRFVVGVPVSLAAISAFVAVLGYLYGASSLYSIAGHTSIALHTTLGFLVACFSLLAARPSRPPVAVVTSATGAGTLLRGLVPLIVAILVLFGWLQLRGAAAHYYDATFGVAMLVASSVILLSVATLFIASRLHAAELAEQRASREIAEREQVLAVTIDSLGEALVSVDGAGRIAMMNPAAERLTGFELSAAAEQPFEQVCRVLDEETRIALGAVPNRLRESALAGTGLLVARDGSERPVAYSMAPVRSETNARDGAVLVLRDVSAERAAALAVRESEARKSAVLNSAFDAILWMDHRGVVVEFNPAAERLFGYTQAQAIGRSVVDLFIPPALREAYLTVLERGLEAAEEPILGKVVEVQAMRADGTEMPVELAVTRVEAQVPPLFTAFVRDTSERRQIERMRERDRFFQLSIDMVCIADRSGNFLQTNPAFERVLGYTQEELLATPYLEFVHPDDRPATLRELESLLSGAPTMDFRNRYRARDGTYHWLQWRAAPDASGLQYAIARDITEDLSTQEALRAGLKEREALLQEVHHRVKNNLQLISSLINLQARPMAPGPGRTALEECQSRVQAIGLIHEKLYQSRDYGVVPFSEYARSLAFDIFYASGVSPDRITLFVEVERVELPVDKAIPCGLILNELLTNALKHAFPGDRAGRITISLGRREGPEIVMTVADDGIGMPAGFEPARSNSLGMELVITLLEQLEGSWEIRPPGTTFRVRFPLEAHK